MNETKKTIVKAALQLFLQKSYKEVTMDELLQMTQLSKGGFYHHFKSKEQLFKVIVSLFYKLQEVDYQHFPNDSLSGFYAYYVQDVTSSLQQLFQYMDNNGQSLPQYNFFLILFDAQRLFPEFKKAKQQQYLNDINAWEQIIRKAKRKKEIRTKISDEEIARLFLLVADGALLRLMNHNSIPDFTSLLLESFNTIYSGFSV